MMVWKMIFLFQGCILRFHVNLPGCSLVPRMHEGNMLWSWHFASGIGRLASRGWLSWDGVERTALDWYPAPVEVGSLSQYLQGFKHIPGGEGRPDFWTINSITAIFLIPTDRTNKPNQRMFIVDPWGTPNTYLTWVWHAYSHLCTRSDNSLLIPLLWKISSFNQSMNYRNLIDTT